MIHQIISFIITNSLWYKELFIFYLQEVMAEDPYYQEVYFMDPSCVCVCA